MTSAPKKKTPAKKPARKPTEKSTPRASAKSKPDTASKADAKADTDAANPKATAKTAPKTAGSKPAGDKPTTASAPSGGGFIWVVAVVVLLGAAAATYPQWSPLLQKLTDRVAGEGHAPVDSMAAGPKTDVPTPSEPPTAETEHDTEPEPETGPADTDGAATQPNPQSASPVAPGTAAAVSPAPATGDDVSMMAALEELSARLTALESRLASLEAAPPATDVDAQVAPLAAKLSGLEDKLSRIDGLGARIAELENRAATRASSMGALSFALSALRDAVRTGAPYRDAVAMAQPLVADDSALAASVAALAVHADRGVPTVGQLAASFGAVAAEAARRRPLADGDGWWQQAVNRLAGLVSVRKVDGYAENALDAALASAERALGTGDLASAVTALDGIDGAAADAVLAWRGQAQARLAVDAAAAELAAGAVRVMRAQPARAE